MSARVNYHKTAVSSTPQHYVGDRGELVWLARFAPGQNMWLRAKQGVRYGSERASSSAVYYFDNLIRAHKLGIDKIFDFGVRLGGAQAVNVERWGFGI